MEDQKIDFQKEILLAYIYEEQLYPKNWDSSRHMREHWIKYKRVRLIRKIAKIGLVLLLIGLIYIII